MTVSVGWLSACDLRRHPNPARQCGVPGGVFHTVPRVLTCGRHVEICLDNSRGGGGKLRLSVV